MSMLQIAILSYLALQPGRQAETPFIVADIQSIFPTITAAEIVAERDSLVLSGLITIGAIPDTYFLVADPVTGQPAEIDPLIPATVTDGINALFPAAVVGPLLGPFLAEVRTYLGSDADVYVAAYTCERVLYGAALRNTDARLRPALLRGARVLELVKIALNQNP